MRLLTRDEIELIWTIDRSEVHHHTYELGEGELVRVPNYFEIPGWRPDAAVKETPVLFDRFDRGRTFVGMFDAEALIGFARGRATPRSLATCRTRGFTSERVDGTGTTRSAKSPHSAGGHPRCSGDISEHWPTRGWFL